MTRVALAGDDAALGLSRLAASLGEHGVDARVVAPAPVAPAERVLGRRGFTGPLTHVPAVVAQLAAGSFDVVHAFSPADAAAARVWRRGTGGPVVFTCTELLDRSSVASGRLRLRLLAAALEDSTAVLAASEEARDALWRWMAVEVPVVDPRDGAAQARIYAEVARPPARSRSRLRARAKRPTGVGR